MEKLIWYSCNREDLLQPCSMETTSKDSSLMFILMMIGILHPGTVHGRFVSELPKAIQLVKVWSLQKTHHKRTEFETYCLGWIPMWPSKSMNRQWSCSCRDSLHVMYGNDDMSGKIRRGVGTQKPRHYNNLIYVLNEADDSAWFWMTRPGVIFGSFIWTSMSFGEVLSTLCQEQLPGTKRRARKFARWDAQVPWCQ